MLEHWYTAWWLLPVWVALVYYGSAVVQGVYLGLRDAYWYYGSVRAMISNFRLTHRG
jgi:hypothetical protein